MDETRRTRSSRSAHIAPPQLRRSLRGVSSSHHGEPPPVNSSGKTVTQVTLVPATQTTVVTTTTTTTTALPPFVLKAPRNLRDRDPETYPLAASPTPAAIRRLKLDFGGHTTYLEEADEGEDHLYNFNRLQASLRGNGGSLQTEESASNPSTSFPSPNPTFPASTVSTTPKHRVSMERFRHPRARTATPISTPDAHELDSLRRRTVLDKRRVNPNTRSRHPLRFGHMIESSPGLHEAGAESEADEESIADESDLKGSMASSSLDPTSSVKPSVSRRHPGGLAGGLQSPAEFDLLAENADATTTASTSLAESDVEPFAALKNSEPQQVRRPTVPNNIDTSSLQDASLPSPSLSPIRATAQLERNRSLIAQARHESDYFDAISEDPAQPLSASTTISDYQSDYEMFGDNQRKGQATFSDIPHIVDTFDHLPDKLKSYVMYQLLRRCAKPTILFVRNAIDPALRCDFLGRLPLELSLQVLDHLDVKSLCRAAQVSKRWRSIVDSHERAWMKLITTDGYQLPDGEVQRAVQEGWGWKYLDSLAEWEEESRQYNNSHDDEETYPASNSTSSSRASLAPSSLNTTLALSGNPTPAFSQDNLITLSAASPTNAAPRSSRKRKSLTLSTASKRRRYRSARHEESRSTTWLESFEAAAGPNAYAQAAAAAVPDPEIGLPSLRNIHLFKSIYQRHHLIRSSWMDPTAKPLHHAFRAHQRHVVTCLQFDSDKILTGSDDANIDIYDTKTGASIARLTGHDGGVWALEYQGDLLVSGSTDRTVRVWDMKHGVALHVFQGHTSTVRCLQILKPVKVGETADGKPIMQPKQPLIITGSRDSTCRIWKLPRIGDPSVFQTGVINDQENPYFVRVLSGHTNSVRAIAAYADTLVSGSYDSTVRVWKVSTGELVHRLQGHNSKVYSVVLDYERGRCISGSMDTTVKIWNLTTGACLYNLEGHSSLVGLLDLKDGVLVSAAADATLRIWDPEDGRCRSTLTAHTGAITCFSHDGQKIISGSDRTLKMWNTQTGECVRDLLSDLSGVWQIKFDQRRCVAAIQRNNWTYIEVLDFGASRDGVPESKRGRRIVVDSRGEEITEEEEEAEQVVEVQQ